MRVNCLLAAKLFGVELSRVAVGNGAAELIRSLTAQIEGPIGTVRPTFEEYPNRFGPGQEVAFSPQAEDLSYDTDDLMAYFGDKGLDALVLINPDNPTGNYLPHNDVLRLADWCEEQGVRLVYDESFSDFADEQGNSLLDDDILAAHPRMVVVKSISKSYGVPGCRLGVLASADEGLVSRIRADESIWNINSFGEFWLQIAEKYQADYRDALARLRDARESMSRRLAENPHLRVFPSQANYLMVELVGTLTATELAERLLAEDEILIKDLSRKVRLGGRQFVRLAVRTTEENERLAAAIEAKTGMDGEI
jgi:histidinol-phosphate/aromatic aminotransferase/cobyric acid decarboxylase-like protein